MSANVLQDIVNVKRKEITASKVDVPESALLRMLADAPPPRNFLAALSEPGPIKLIAEVKKASPSAGVIRENFEPVEIAKAYDAHGAACISVLTDQPFFQGRLDYLSEIRRNVSLPLLRKDFILDRYQVLEARAAGADAVLLIAECLDDCQLRALHNEIIELGMTPLVELYDPANLPRVIDAGAELIGVNNRDLQTFKVTLEHTLSLRPLIPEGCVLVSESGIKTRADVARLEAAGVNAILVGETLMRQSDIGAAVDQLLGR